MIQWPSEHFLYRLDLVLLLSDTELFCSFSHGCRCLRLNHVYPVFIFLYFDLVSVSGFVVLAVGCFCSFLDKLQAKPIT